MNIPLPTESDRDIYHPNCGLQTLYFAYSRGEKGADYMACRLIRLLAAEQAEVVRLRAADANYDAAAAERKSLRVQLAERDRQIAALSNVLVNFVTGCECQLGPFDGADVFPGSKSCLEWNRDNPSRTVSPCKVCLAARVLAETAPKEET